MTEILVAGATGLLGSRICRSLVSAQQPVRALVRPGSEERLGDLRGRVEIVHGDLRDRASLDRACRGVQVVVSGVTAILSEDPNLIDAVDHDGNLALIEAAADAGVERFVFVSIASDIQGDYPLGRAKRGAEQALGTSGLAHVIVQPGCFMEVWLGPILGLGRAVAASSR